MTEAEAPTRNGSWLKCRSCSHVWIAAYFPIAAEKIAEVFRKTACPKCQSGNVAIALTEDIPPEAAS